MENTEKRTKSVDATTFLKAAWEAHREGEGLAGIAKRTGMKTAAISTRLSSLKKKNVKVPSFKTGGNNKLNVDALNALSEQLEAA